MAERYDFTFQMTVRGIALNGYGDPELEELKRELIQLANQQARQEMCGPWREAHVPDETVITHLQLIEPDQVAKVTVSVDLVATVKLPADADGAADELIRERFTDDWARRFISIQDVEVTDAEVTEWDIDGDTDPEYVTARVGE